MDLVMMLSLGLGPSALVFISEDKEATDRREIQLKMEVIS
jgi:hypothetical protein